MEKSAFLVRPCVRDSSGIPVDKPDIADSPAAALSKPESECQTGRHALRFYSSIGTQIRWRSSGLAQNVKSGVVNAKTHGIRIRRNAKIVSGRVYKSGLTVLDDVCGVVHKIVQRVIDISA